MSAGSRHLVQRARTVMSRMDAGGLACTARGPRPAKAPATPGCAGARHTSELAVEGQLEVACPHRGLAPLLKRERLRLIRERPWFTGERPWLMRRRPWLIGERPWFIRECSRLIGERLCLIGRCGATFNQPSQPPPTVRRLHNNLPYSTLLTYAVVYSYSLVYSTILL